LRFAPGYATNQHLAQRTGPVAATTLIYLYKLTTHTATDCWHHVITRLTHSMVLVDLGIWSVILLT